MSNQFHVHEYNSLRQEIIEDIRQIGELNKFILISVAFSIAWLLNDAGRLDGMTSFIGAWIPFFITQWFIAYRKDIGESIFTLGNYIKEIEQKYGDSDLGWQTKYREIDGKRISTFRRTRAINKFLQIFTLFFAGYYIYRYSIGASFVNDIINQINS